MPAPITVIIPTLNTAATLGPTLSCLFQGVEAGLIHELILADGGSTDDLEALAAAVGARIVTAPTGRGTQLAAAARTVRTDWILTLHADTTLNDGWTDAVADHIATSRRAAHFRLAFDTPGFPARLTAAWANLRARLFQLPYGDQGLLIARTTYAEVGGYPELPLMEDVVIARNLRGQLTALPATATTSAAKYVDQGWLRRGSRNLLTLARFLCGTPAEKLAASYRKP